MHAMCSFKRSPPLTETEATILAEETHTFGYKPEIMELDGQFHLKIRGDGTSDAVFAARLAQLRKPKWISPNPTMAVPVPMPIMARRRS